MAENQFNYLDPEEYLNHNPFMKYNHMEIVTISPECSEIRLKVNPDSLNLGGHVHGGLLYSLADVVTGITARADGRRYVTQSAHINFIRNISEGVVIARGEMVRRGRTISIVRSTVPDEQGTLLAEATVDMFCTGE